MPQQPKENPTIIETIDRMIKSGESEDKILGTLKDLGISDQNARRLLILGQADVFSLLKGEIRKTLREEIAKQKPELSQSTKSEAHAAVQSAKSEIRKAVETELREYEKNLEKQNRELKEQLEQKIKKINEIEAKTKRDIDTRNRGFYQQIKQTIKNVGGGGGVGSLTHTEVMDIMKEYDRKFTKRLSELKGPQGGANRETVEQTMELQNRVMESLKQYQKNLEDQNNAFKHQIEKEMDEIKKLPQIEPSEMLERTKKMQATIIEMVGKLNKSGVSAETIQKINNMPETTKGELTEKVRAIQESINARITQMNKEQQKAQAELTKQNEELRKSMEEKIKQLSEEGEKARGEMWKESRGFGQSMREELLSQTKTFQEQMNQRMKQINQMQDKNRQQLGQMADSMSKIEADVSEAGIRAVNPASGRIVGYAVIVLGIIFGAGTLYVFYTSLGEPFTAYTLVVMTVMAIITVTLLVIGTLI